MNLERIRKLLKQKENIRLEFKESRSALPDNLFETICAMLNRDGGDIFLGVDDAGHIIGIDPQHIDTITNNLVNLSNNPHGEGQLSLADFTPYPKNPTLSKFFMQLGRVEELGSGFLNVHKYLGYYASKKKPQFIEGPRFKTIIPLDESLMAEYGRVNGSVNELIIKGIDEKIVSEINDAVRQKLIEMTMLVHATPKQKKPELAKKMSISIRTATRYLKILQDLGITSFEGVPKTGGYVLSSDFLEDIEQ